MEVESWARGFAVSRLEEIGESPTYCRGGGVIGPDGEDLLPGKRSQIVEAEHVVGVGVGQKHAVEGLKPGIERLHAEVGAGVDEPSPLPLLQKNGNATAAVARVG